MSEQKIAAITGATGFVGGNLARSLLARGYRLRALVRDRAAAADLERAGAELQVGDVRDPASLKGLADGVGKFFHIAALFRQAGHPDQTYWDINHQGTINCLDEAVRAGVGRFIHCSTVGVLSNIEHPPADETTPYNPGDVYQESKTAAEKAALDYFRRGRIEGTVVRPAMIYGPGDLRMLKLFKAVARRRWVMLGSGKTLAHFVYIDDLVDGFWLASETPGINGEIFIIVGPLPAQLNELVSLIAQEAGVPQPRLKLPVQPFQWLGSLCETIMVPLHLEPPIYRRRVDFFTKNRSFSIEKARRMLAYEPRVDLREGVRRTLQWYRSQGLI